MTLISPALMRGYAPRQSLGYVNVQFPPYNAKGDGTTDDADSIQRALNVGGRIYIPTPKVNYRILSQLSPKSNSLILGDGYSSFLNFNVAEIAFGAGALSNVRVWGLRFGGVAARLLMFTTTTSLRIRDCFLSGATLAGAGLTSGLYLSSVTDVWIEDNEFTGNGLGGAGLGGSDIFVDTGASTRVQILQNRCLSTLGKYNIQTYNLSSSEISGNICDGALVNAANTSGYGILIYDTLGTGTTKNNKITKNHVSNCQGTGIYIAGSHSTDVIGNTLDTIATLQTDGLLTVGGIANNGGDYCAISGNTIRNSSKAGIVALGRWNAVTGNTIKSCTKAGIYIYGVADFTSFTGNTIDACGGGIIGWDGTAVKGLAIGANVVTNTTGITHGIQHTNISDSSVNGNTVTSAGGFGIILQGGARNVANSNVVRGASVGNVNTYSGMRIDTADTEIIGNSSRNIGATGQTYGLETDVTATTCRIVGNEFGGQTAATSLSAQTVAGSVIGMNGGIAGAGLGYSTGAGGAVTQITSSATAVTLNKPSGQITTVALTTAAGANERFTVNNSGVAVTDAIAIATTYNGAGLPSVFILNVTAGTFDVIIKNQHATVALNAVMVITFALVKAVVA